MKQSLNLEYFDFFQIESKIKNTAIDQKDLRSPPGGISINPPFTFRFSKIF